MAAAAGVSKALADSPRPASNVLVSFTPNLNIIRNNITYAARVCLPGDVRDNTQYGRKAVTHWVIVPGQQIGHA